jgi:hypothetical protein
MASLLNKLSFGFLGSFGQRDGFVAFDIGSSSIKMIEAVPEKSGWRLLNAGSQGLPAGAVQNCSRALRDNEKTRAACAKRRRTGR